jgi:chromodomain-helicase-DNA-binding protein 4
LTCSFNLYFFFSRNQESTDPDSDQKENWANDYLSSFKVASYATVENDLNTSTSSTAANSQLSKEDPFYWNKLMKVTGTQVEDNLRKKNNEPKVPIILGKRVRKTVSKSFMTTFVTY